MRKLAIIGGLGYVVIFITGIFANFFVLEQLKVVGDMTTTFENIQQNSSAFVQALVAFVLMVVFDIILTWVLYKIFKDQNPRLAKISAWLRFVNALFFGAALIYLFQVLGSVQHGATQEAIVKVDAELSAFNSVWLVGLLFFGIHLMLLSILLFQSKRVFKVIPVLLFIAGVGYLIDSTLQFVYADYASIAEISALVVVLPGVVGELSLTGWLLFKAGKSKKSKHALKTAHSA
ncbi:MAG: DUF4386 domain-containing protein [bacterium]|nr:DUF4386 domain-containing protein [bacterium]